jgi:hypothetical protein
MPAQRFSLPATSLPTARRDLDRIFNTGGVAALVGNTYGAAKDVGVYVTGEAIRGLADLEAKERERCANFASKAVAAGLAERTVRIAERQAQLMVEMVQAALREVDLPPDQASAFKAALARQARELNVLRTCSGPLPRVGLKSGNVSGREDLDGGSGAPSKQSDQSQ